MSTRRPAETTACAAMAPPKPLPITSTSQSSRVDVSPPPIHRTPTALVSARAHPAAAGAWLTGWREQVAGRRRVEGRSERRSGGRCSGERHGGRFRREWRSEEHTSELQSRENLVCRLLLEKKKRRRQLG